MRLWQWWRGIGKEINLIDGAIELSVSELVRPWEVLAIAGDVRQMRLEMGLEFAWAGRTANGLAHVVAQKARGGLLPQNWVASPWVQHGTPIDNAVDRSVTIDYYYGVILSSRNIHCGFTCTESCNNANFFSVFLFGVGEYGMVWSANRDHPLKENATIAMTKDGDQVLRDSRDSGGTKVWSTDTSGKSVMGMSIFFLWYIGNSTGMNITEVGNLVLFDNTGGIVWQSFDNPTNSLVGGPRLHEGQRLITNSRKTNWSHGLYYATLTCATGFASYNTTNQGQAQMYYQLMPDQSIRSSDMSSNYAELQHDGFLQNSGIASYVR
ncbi:hypothetical protein RHSIM_RhsimUnG0189600 [Rhododendron simsii]|uniref:Bulb-type lectin domain-containing protein n=1 Tax=Rhododendron simsii TaxID=118357 RepID=A0A834FWE0_RHOSS|nr:hypothetical protein RHSIM_RhsimUnG0189600 [Rhododendron simsii]